MVGILAWNKPFAANVSLDKLVRIETMMETLIGGAQPGRVKTAEDKIREWERSDVRRNAHNHLMNAGISAGISVAIAFHRYWLKP